MGNDQHGHVTALRPSYCSASRHGRIFSALLPSTRPRGCGEGLILSAKALKGDIFFINLQGPLSCGRAGIRRLGSGDLCMLEGVVPPIEARARNPFEEVNVSRKPLISNGHLV